MIRIVLFTILGLLGYSTSFGQQQVLVQEVVTVTLPENMEKLTKDKLAALEPKDKKTYPIVYEQFPGESYKGKDFLVQLNASAIDTKPGFLEQRKMEMDDLFSLSEPEVYNTSIKRFQKHAAVITNYEYAAETKGCFIIAGYSNSGDSILVGIMEYEKAGKTAAEEALNQILNSITFKN